MTAVKPHSYVDYGHGLVYTGHMEMPEGDRQILGKRLFAARTERRLSQTKLGLMAGVDGSYISKLEKGTMLNPTRDAISRIAAALGMPFEALWPSDDALEYVRRAELIELKEEMQRLAARLPVAEPDPPPIQVVEPPMSYVGAAAANRRRGEDVIDHLDPSRFVLRVRGECLLPEIAPGTLLVFDQERSVRIGSVVAAIVNGELQIKRVLEHNGRWVLADAHGDRVIERDNITVWGVMVPEPD